RQMQEHQPARLGQARLLQPFFETLAPLPVHAPELYPELLADIHNDSFLSNRVLSVSLVFRLGNDVAKVCRCIGKSCLPMTARSRGGARCARARCLPGFAAPRWCCLRW